MNIYTFSESSHQIRIVRMSDMKLQKILMLPESLSSVELYLSKGKLVLIGHKYTTEGAFYSYRYYAPEMKTVVAVYDIMTPENPKLERYHQIDGDYRDSRLIGSILYFLSTNTLRMPPIYLSADQQENDTDYQTSLKKLRADFALKYIVPQIREARSSVNAGKYTQSIRSSVASCSDITFVLPDEETVKHIDFSPSFVSLSSLDISTPISKMKSQLLFGDVSQIHMSQSSLYITSTISQTTPDTTTSNTKIAPWNGQYESSTLVHRYALDNGIITYKYTTRLPGNPMNQYSMDEDGRGNFRIVTQKYSWSSGGNKNTTELSVLSPE